MFHFFKSGYQKLKKALNKTRSVLGRGLKELFTQPIDAETFDKLEQILYEADLGSQCTSDFVEKTRTYLGKNKQASFDQIIAHLKEFSLEILALPPSVKPKAPREGEPLVILIVGVNGSGKTTTLAKLANRYSGEEKKVLLAAADTFRAAAIEQLETWSERIGVEIVKSQPGADPSAVVFDALSAAKARAVDIVLVDTAGRLQNKKELMQELEKMQRTMTKLIQDAPHETLLILDATTGQNGIDQAKTFHRSTPLTGLILTKLDGSAKGGIVLSIYKELQIPISYIGVGEQVGDLMPFDAGEYVDALFEGDE